MNETEDVSQGQHLLSAIERILAEPGSLIAYADDCLKRGAAGGGDQPIIRRRAVKEVVTHYSNCTAVSGGAAAIPALLPGVGTVVAVGGGALADMGLVLKYEIEMALVLARVYGYDIRLDAERQRAMLLASITTYDVKSDGNFLSDVVQAEKMAIWNYSPRQATKLLVTVLARLAVRSASKSLFRAIPLVGIAVGSSINKALTTRVGERCARELDLRRESMDKAVSADDDVVDAHVRH